MSTRIQNTQQVYTQQNNRFYIKSHLKPFISRNNPIVSNGINGHLIKFKTNARYSDDKIM